MTQTKLLDLIYNKLNELEEGYYKDWDKAIDDKDFEVGTNLCQGKVRATRDVKNFIISLYGREL